LAVRKCAICWVHAIWPRNPTCRSPLATESCSRSNDFRSYALARYALHLPPQLYSIRSRPPPLPPRPIAVTSETEKKFIKKKLKTPKVHSSFSFYPLFFHRENAKRNGPNDAGRLDDDVRCCQLLLRKRICPPAEGAVGRPQYFLHTSQCIYLSQSSHTFVVVVVYYHFPGRAVICRAVVVFRVTATRPRSTIDPDAADVTASLRHRYVTITRI